MGIGMRVSVGHDELNDQNDHLVNASVRIAEIVKNPLKCDKFVHKIDLGPENRRRYTFLTTSNKFVVV